MNPYHLFGENTELSPMARLIMRQDLAALEQCLLQGWELNRPFDNCEHIKELPLTLALALVENKTVVVDWLINNGVELNDTNFFDRAAKVDNYGAEGFLVWLKKDRKLATIDYEHERVIKLCRWHEFSAHPDKWIQKCLFTR